MKIKRTKDYILVDDWLSKKQLTRIFEELEILKTKCRVSVVGKGGQDITKTHKSIIVDVDLYYRKSRLKREDSAVLDIIDKQFWGKDIYSILKGSENVFGILPFTSFDRTALQFYRNGGFYEVHGDGVYGGELIVVALFFCKEPKKFTGGNFLLGDHIIEHKNNRMVIFPAFLSHGVSRIKMKSDDWIDGRIAFQHRTWFKDNLKSKAE